MEIPKICNLCGNEGVKKCSGCNQVRYCGQEHQRKDWKEHKKVCFPVGVICTRCQQEASKSPVCRVPHPNHLLEGAGSTHGSGESSYSFECKACRQSFTRAGDNGGDWSRTASSFPITGGAEWCYDGTHTIKELQESDNRRLFSDIAIISPPNVQRQIDALAGTNVRVIKIYADGGYFNDTEMPTLNQEFPALTQLQIEDVDFKRIVLKESNVPKLRGISFQNVTENCYIDIILPELRSFSIQYHGPSDRDWIQETLKTATKLVTFDSYKLRVPNLGFYSNHLKSIRLHRAEMTSYLELWAPVLELLNLQACYCLDTIKFLKDHPLDAELSDDFSFHKELYVKAMNANLGEEAIEAIQNHPRVLDFEPDEPDGFLF